MATGVEHATVTHGAMRAAETGNGQVGIKDEARRIVGQVMVGCQALRCSARTTPATLAPPRLERVTMRHDREMEPNILGHPLFRDVQRIQYQLSWTPIYRPLPH